MNLGRIATGTVLIVSLAAAGAGRAPAGAATTRNGMLAWSSGDTATSEIFTAKPDGSGVKQLTHNRVTDASPRWSPDGKQIAFYSEAGPRGARAELWVMNTDGSGARQLTRSGGMVVEGASWSPDGRQLVYAADYQLRIINADGSGDHPFVTGPGFFVFDPAWSPDGNWIAYAGRGPGGGSFDVHVVRLDGTGHRRVVSTRTASEYNPRWSPDGARLYFSQNQKGFHATVVDVDGTDLRSLTTAESSDPVPSPDGTRVAIYSCDGSAGCGAYALAPLGGPVTGPRLIADHAAADWQPLP